MQFETLPHPDKVVVAVLFGFVCFSLALDELGSSSTLIISVYDVSVNAVEIDWHYEGSLHAPIVSCELVYGPVNDHAQVQVYTGIIIVPEERLLKLSGLENNVTYHLRMNCHNRKGSNFQSNVLQFTTGSKPFPLNYAMPSSSFHDHSSLSRTAFYSRDDDHMKNLRSSNVILGAVCGIVGFLIINVTIVMVVRKYSHLQMHRRRIMEIEERDYDEFPYLRGYE